MFVSCVLLFFFLFFTQNKVREKIIGIGRVIYNIKALSVVTRTTLKIFQKFILVSRKTG